MSLDILLIELDQSMEHRIWEPLFWELGEPLLHVLLPDVVQAFARLLRVRAQGPVPGTNELRNMEHQGMHLGGPSTIQLHKQVLKALNRFLPIISQDIAEAFLKTLSK